MSRITNLAICVAAFAVTFGSPRLLTVASAADDTTPNVLVILTDDQGWGDLSLHGNPNLQTPNIDSLARDGANIKNFYVCAVCSPTRAEFLTGRYHTRMGVYSTSQGGERFDLAERTIGQVFSDAGYQTAAYGKWHSGMQAPYHPNSRGFGDFYGFCSGHWGNYFSPILEHNGKTVHGNGFITNDLTDHAIEFIRGHRDAPFFVYLPLNTPHAPMQVPDEDWKPFSDKELVPDPRPENAKRQKLDHTRAALALCENIDRNVGRLLETLDSLDIADETIVVFFCDNGPNGYRFNGGLRGVKGSVFEGGLRSPCLVRWPAQIPAGTEVESVAGAVDLMPTLTQLAGVEISATAGPLDGVSFADQLSDESQKPDEASPAKRLLFSSWRGRSSVRSQRFRYHLNGTMYEIASDPGEQIDVSKKYPNVAARLKNQLERWRDETNAAASPSESEPVFAVGHLDAQWTQLPVRDATSSGSIRRSSRHPNSTYFFDWTDSKDTIDWNVDVVAGGTFEVQLWYACDETALGTELELSFESDGHLIGEPTKARVSEVTPSGFVAVEFDRAPRTEGYEKDWRPMSLGTIRLPEAGGTLRLRAPDIQGETGVEVRLMVLRRDS
ncbi:arylsulfatase [Rhodopirellula sp. SWK7]|uniref:arylsulfatase n=1 Tax=Rhodopirellula sp. SWK7 TaxID=595460 RepID=UPI0002BDA8CD|nr:arylsulfatase [Rhodopirellula sp. SWK7]EMI43394.1 N-acetylgalactosamine 6-sulfate sulfatase (GALNS) [Rhodopirellula sp. SWK7]